MVFWHNDRYSAIEKQCGTGDPLRGLPPKKFPLSLKSFSFYDDSHDFWEVELFCQGLETEKFSKKVKAELVYRACSRISKENLIKTGISHERMDLLDIADWDSFEEKYVCFIVVDFEKIVEKSEHFTQEFMEKIRKKYTLSCKRNLLLNHIRKGSLSRFLDIA